MINRILPHHDTSPVSCSCGIEAFRRDAAPLLWTRLFGLAPARFALAWVAVGLALLPSCRMFHVEHLILRGLCSWLSAHRCFGEGVGQLPAIGFSGIEGDFRDGVVATSPCPDTDICCRITARVTTPLAPRSDFVSVLDRRWPGATLLNSAAKSR